jgi:hypothetical protein
VRTVLDSSLHQRVHSGPTPTQPIVAASAMPGAFDICSG